MSGSAFSRADARVRAHRLWLFVLGTVGMSASFVATLAFGLSGWLTIAGSAWQLVALALWTRWWSERRGRLRADEEGLWLGDEGVAARKAVRHAHVVTRDGEAIVRLVTRWGSTEVALADAEEAAALLETLRLDPGQSVAQYVMQHGTYRSGWLRVGAGVASGMVLIPLLALASLILVPIGFVLWYAALLYLTTSHVVHVAVGADGVRIRRFPRRERFVPFGAIASAETTDGRDVALWLRDGEVIWIHHQMGKGWARSLRVDRADEAKQLVARVEARIEQHRHGATDVAALARGERTTADWMRDVAKSSDQHASFRANAVPPEALWRVVEDPARRRPRGPAPRSLSGAGSTRRGASASACSPTRARRRSSASRSRPPRRTRTKPRSRPRTTSSATSAADDAQRRICEPVVSAGAFAIT